MNKAVIYPRFSSHGQNDQSIEGQIRICREFAESKGFNIVNVYPEKARTGTNDDRPAFQRMIKDAQSGAFQYIIVYMFDRFARNRRDSIMYKEMLREKHGIKVLSALEPITDDEGGEFYEMFLEWNAEKYSKRLSKRVSVDEEQAAIVRYVFEEYGKGVEKKGIAAALNAQGHRYKGKPFTGKSFDKWVVNPKYAGVFSFGGACL